MRAEAASWRLRCCFLALCLLLGSNAAAQEADNPSIGDNILREFPWRTVGPFRGGRSVAVSGDYQDRETYWFGSCGGGVWKTTDGGTTWNNKSDGFFRTGSVGAIAVSPHDSQTVFVGMGECSLRGDISHGDGVYRTTDGGDTWQHLGLTDSQHISRVVVHPRDPQAVFVAVLGRLAGPSRERGLYRSRDGGKTWEQVLFHDETSGVIDFEIDSQNPDLMFAATWEVRRRPWGLRHGGKGSVVYRSRDGGDTWEKLSGRGGLPGGMTERIALACSAKSGRVWALVSSEHDRGIFMSDNAGETWQKKNDHPDLFVRPFYFHHMKADPVDPDTVYFLNFRIWKSTDAGKSFTKVNEFHPDHHDLWIDPADNSRMIDASDGGVVISTNAGKSWTKAYNQPTGQFYSLALSYDYPFQICGPQQDWSTVMVPHREWMQDYDVPLVFDTGYSEAGFMAFDPSDRSRVYIGDHHWLYDFDRQTRSVKNIAPWDEIQYGWGTKDIPYRFNWTFPVHIPKRAPSQLLVGSQYVHRTSDRGKTWQRISPDLTRADPTTLEATPRPDSNDVKDSKFWGPLTRDSNGDQWYATLFCIESSPLNADVIWTGSDDGRISLTRDGGKTWSDVSPKLPDGYGHCSSLCPSPHDEAVVWAAVHRYRSDDSSPWLFQCQDFGKSWKRVDAGLPRNSFVRCVVEDPEVAGLLFCGSETGLHCSLDTGKSWGKLGSGLPSVPVHDLEIRGSTLVLATHGRGFWLFDHLTVLRDWAKEQRQGRTHREPLLSVPAEFVRSIGTLSTPGSSSSLPICLWLPKPVEVQVNILNEDGELVRALSLPNATIDTTAKETGSTNGMSFQKVAPASLEKKPVGFQTGWHHMKWDLCLESAPVVPGAVLRGSTNVAPQVLPGKYVVEVVLCELDSKRKLAAVWNMKHDPRSDATSEELHAKFEFQVKIRKTIADVNLVVLGLRAMREELSKVSEKAGEEIRRRTDELLDRLGALEDRLIQHRARVSKNLLAMPVQLDNKLYTLAGRIADSDAAPTQAQWQLFEQLREQAAKLQGELRALQSKDYPALLQNIKSSE